MSTVSKRELIKQAYRNSKAWSSKVDKMSEGQVTAIFFKLKQQGKV